MFSKESLLIVSHLQEALTRINPSITSSSLQQAIREVQSVNTHGDLIACNQYFQKLLTEDIDTPFTEKGVSKFESLNYYH